MEQYEKGIQVLEAVCGNDQEKVISLSIIAREGGQIFYELDHQAKQDSRKTRFI